MNNLPRVIGPAPSELSWEELLEKLGKERDRVRRAIELFRASVKPAKKEPAKRKELDKQIRLLMEKHNLTEDEVLKIVETL